MFRRWTMKIPNKIQWWIDAHIWKAVWNITYSCAHNYRYCPKLIYAINEAAWNRVCGGPQSFWLIFKLSMGWHQAS